MQNDYVMAHVVATASLPRFRPDRYFEDGLTGWVWIAQVDGWLHAKVKIAKLGSQTGITV